MIARSVRAAVTSMTWPGIEAGAVLHRVEQHLAEGGHQQVAPVFGQRRFPLGEGPA